MAHKGVEPPMSAWQVMDFSVTVSDEDLEVALAANSRENMAMTANPNMWVPFDVKSGHTPTLVCHAHRGTST